MNRRLLHAALFFVLFSYGESAYCQTQGSLLERELTNYVFANEYKPQYYSKYEQPLNIEGDTYFYKEVAVTVAPKPELRTLFDSGLFYPNIIQQSYNKQRLKIDKATMADFKKYKIPLKPSKTVYPQFGVSVNDLEELAYPEIGNKRKRFKMLIFDCSTGKPNGYLLELTNKKATTTMNNADFIKGAALTFFKACWREI